MKTKLLIIEDDLSIIKLFKESFSSEGFEVEILSTGKKAMEKLKEIREREYPSPNLILLDLILPDMNGIEILKEVRKYPETKNIKVFVLTNYSDEAFNKELVEEGVNKILLKAQYSLGEITEIIKEAVK